MIFKRINSLHKNDGGAVLLQTLLGLGIMVAMTPVILNQIRKYNDSVNREEVISEMALLQKAVTSFISFDRTSIPNGCVVKSGNEMKNLLSDYGGERLAISNSFGQNYSFVTCKKQVIAGDSSSDIIEAAIFAHGDVNDLTLNSIGEYLFDQGVVLSTNDHVELTNYNAKLSATLKEQIVNTIGNQGALVMFVSDAFMVSDYLYISKGPGGTTSVNTMLTNINMNGNSLIDVYKANGTSLNILKSMKVAGLAGKNLNIANSKVSGIFSIENTTPFIPDEPMKITTNSIDISSLQVEDAEFLKVAFDPGDLKANELNTSSIVVEGDLNVVPFEEDEGKFIWNFGASEVVADNLYSKGSISNKFGNIVLKDDEDGVDSYIYDGKVSLTGDFTEASSMINLSGVSEVYDICYFADNLNMSVCLSSLLKNFRDELIALWNKYTEKAGGA
ncbi:hypothetical protein HDR59_02035 [bacterium]|nr:hypothetical protein [bacterium]